MLILYVYGKNYKGDIMNLGFDLDEVIAQTATMAVEHTNEIYQCNLTTDVLKSFYFDENTYSEDSDKQKAVEETLLKAVSNPELMATIKPYPGAVRVLNKLKHQGHKIFIVTKRDKKDTLMTIEWLRANDIPFHKVAVTHMEEKGFFANKFRLDFFVDDLEWNLYELHSARKLWKKGLFLMTRPWNEGNYVDTSKITRVNGWNQILQAVGIGNRLRT